MLAIAQKIDAKEAVKIIKQKKAAHNKVIHLKRNDFIDIKLKIKDTMRIR